LSSLDALARISARVGDRTELYLDGGIRRGADIAIALSLGARGVFIGRPFLYGLAVGGEAGVGMVLKIFAEELRRVLVLMGCESVTTLDRDWLEAPDQAGA
jgi:L-lactate dehydrogenase (cytochrome)